MRAKPGQHISFIEAAASSTTDECILWPFGLATNGYGHTQFNGRKRGVHRIVLILTTKIDPPNMDAAHGPCHIRSCVNPRHLSWKTCQENTHDMKRDGTVQAKLTVNQNTEIHQLRASGWLLRELAEKFGVTISSISHVLSKRNPQ